jgi:hypothetical protein
LGSIGKPGRQPANKANDGPACQFPTPHDAVSRCSNQSLSLVGCAFGRYEGPPLPGCCNRLLGWQLFFRSNFESFDEFKRLAK